MRILRRLFRKQGVCKHESGIGGDTAAGMYGFCPKCGLRSPCYPFVSGTWGSELLNRAIRDGTAHYPVAK